MDYRALLLYRISNGIELLSALVLLIGFAKGIWGFIVWEARMFRHTDQDIIVPGQGIASLRPLVGSYILLGLDFYIVSDILESMLRPDWQELLSLAVIVVLRTTIGYFLGKELAESHTRPAA